MTNSNVTKPYSKSAHLWLFILSIPLLILNFLYVPECDELYMREWRFENMLDRLLTMPIPMDGVVIGVPRNGRILGNFLGVLQSQLLMTEYYWIRSFIFTASLIVFILLVGKLFGRSNNVANNLALSAFLLLCTPLPYYQEVFSWGVAFINYFLPIFGFFLLMYFLQSNQFGRWIPVLLFLLAFSIQLYIEHTSIAFCLFALYVAFDTTYQRLNRYAVSSGLLLGMAAMLYWTRYVTTHLGEGIHSFGRVNYLKNICSIAQNGFLNNILIITLLSLFLLVLRKKASMVERLWVVTLVLSAWFYNFFAQSLDIPFIALFISMLICVTWIIQWFLIPRDKYWKQAGILFALSLASLAPLVAVSSGLHARMYFGSYMLLCATCILLAPQTLPNWTRKGLYISTIIFLLLLIPPYYKNFEANQSRIDIGLTQIEAGAKNITLPLLPYPELAINEKVGKGDLVYLLYNQVPWDVKLNFVKWRD